MSWGSFAISVLGFAAVSLCLSYPYMAQQYAWPYGAVWQRDSVVTGLTLLGYGFAFGFGFYHLVWWLVLIAAISGFIVAFVLTFALKQAVQLLVFVGMPTLWIVMLFWR